MCHNCCSESVLLQNSAMPLSRRRELARRMATPPSQPLDLAANGYLSLPEEATIATVRQEWQAATTYAETLHLSRLFLTGERNCNINCGGPLDPESKKQVAGLLSLHNYGVLTHNSQPYWRPRPEILEQGGGFWAQQRQRPYLQFLIPQRNRIPVLCVDLFADLLMAHPKIVTRICSANWTPPMRCNFEDENQHVVTKERAALSIRELYREPWTEVTILPPMDANEFQEWGVGIINAAKPYDIAVAARSWDERLDLVELVKDIAKAAGIGPMYIENTQPTRSERLASQSP